jgi:hypothetical protein
VRPPISSTGVASCGLPGRCHVARLGRCTFAGGTPPSPACARGGGPSLRLAVWPSRPLLPAIGSSSFLRDRACVCIARALPRALASQAILPATGIRPGRLLSVSTTAESAAAGSPVPTHSSGAARRSALSAGMPSGCMSGRLMTRPLRHPCPVWTRPITSRWPVFALDSSDVRSSPDHGQLARGVTTSRSPFIPVTPRSAALMTSLSHRGIAVPPCTGRDRNCTDHRMSQL